MGRGSRSDAAPPNVLRLAALDDLLDEQPSAPTWLTGPRPQPASQTQPISSPVAPEGEADNSLRSIHPVDCDCDDCRRGVARPLNKANSDERRRCARGELDNNSGRDFFIEFCDHQPPAGLQLAHPEHWRDPTLIQYADDGYNSFGTKYHAKCARCGSAVATNMYGMGGCRACNTDRNPMAGR